MEWKVLYKISDFIPIGQKTWMPSAMGNSCF